MADFHTWLSNFRTQKGDTHTHTRIGNKQYGISGGSYNIPQISEEDFLKRYYEHVFINKNKEYITERQLIGNNKRVVLDIDFRYSDDIKTRQHKEEDIRDLLWFYMTYLCDIHDFPNDYKVDIYVMEKPDVNILEGKTKDGIHIIFNMCMDAKYQQIIRKQLIVKLRDFWDHIPHVNTLEDVIDEGIVKGSVNWNLIGSRKPANQEYKITYFYTFTFNKDKEMWEVKDNSIENIDLKNDIYKLSVRCPHINHIIPNKIIEDDITSSQSGESEKLDDDNSDIDEREDITLPRDIILKYIEGMGEECYKEGDGNCAFNIFCALKKVGAKKMDIRKLMQRENKRYYNDTWFELTWKQETNKYAYGLEYIKSKSTYREPNPLAGSCLIDVNNLEDTKKEKEKEHIHDIIWNAFIEWIKTEKLIRIKNTEYVCVKEREYYAKKLYETCNETLNGFIEKHQSLFAGKGLQGKRALIRTFLDEQQPHDDFPFKQLDFRYYGYKNGLYNIETDEFITEEFPDDILCRKYFDEDFNPLTEIPPELQEIYDTQNFTKETCEVNMCLLGRCLFPINHLENWGVFMYNFGMSNTGKSTITETIVNAIERDKISTMSVGKDSSNRFSLYGKENKELILITEAENLTNVFSSEQIKTISRGELTEVEGKCKDAKAVDWKTNLLLAGNGELKFKDDSNGISNRFATFKYENTPKEPKENIKAQLIKSVPRLIPLYIRTYHKFIKKGNLEFSEQMLDWKTTLAVEEDDFKLWLDTPNEDLHTQLIYKKDHVIRSKDLCDKYNCFIKYDLGKNCKRRITMSNNEYLNELGIVKYSENICKFCNNPHKKGCCDKYKRSGRTSAVYYRNCKLISGGKNNNPYDSDDD